MENMSEEELGKELYNYIVENYDFEFCDNFGNEMQFTLSNNKTIVVSVNVEVYENEE